MSPGRIHRPDDIVPTATHIFTQLFFLVKLSIDPQDALAAQKSGAGNEIPS